MEERMKTIVLITNIPTPYRVPLFNELDAALRNRGRKLHVIFGASTYARRKFTLDPASFQFEHTFLDASVIQRGDNEKTTFLYKGLNKTLDRISPEKIIVSGFSPATAKIYLRNVTRLLTFRRSTPFIIWNGSIEDSYRSEGLIKRLFRRSIACRASAAVAYGSRAKDYLVKLGVPTDRVFIGINTVDTSFFSRATEKARQAQAMNTAVDSSSVQHLLSIGYLSPRKNTQQLIELMKLIYARNKNVVLDIVGDGSDREALEKLAQSYGLSGVIRFHGYLQKEALPELMAKASLFLFQTDFDIWGLVLNEAMSAGLPVICSPNAGAATDLIREGETGYIMDFNQPEKVAERVLLLLSDAEECQRVGTAASGYISRFATIQNSVSGFLSAIA
jgi:glycosyltransferase involved in cell wall biosynthesis